MMSMHEQERGEPTSRIGAFSKQFTLHEAIVSRLAPARRLIQAPAAPPTTRSALPPPPCSIRHS
eukprot:5366806-Pleurochrysis_carterae.AAC.2